MNDGAYLPVPDVAAYLARIGIDAAREPTLGFLDELVCAHQTHVPFENLDVYDKQLDPSLAVADLFDKVVLRRRGGYCFELNGLFCALLRDLGFCVWPGMARVFLRPDLHPAISHRVSIVQFDDGLYMADVGFGGPVAACALRIEDGARRSACGQRFAVRAASEHWWDVLYTDHAGEERKVLAVCSLPSEEADFAALSFFQSQAPVSSFRQRRIVNIRTEGGSCSLENMTLTEHVGGVSTTRDLSDEIELEQVLFEVFGIKDWR